MKMLMGLAVGLALVAVAPAGAQIVDEQRQTEALRHYRAGQELMAAEQFEKAADEFLKAIDRNPLLTLAHYELGRSYMALKRYASAIQAYQGCKEAYVKIAGLQQNDAAAADRMREREILELRDAISMIRSGTLKFTGSAPDHKIAQLETRIRELERQRQADLTGTGFIIPGEVSLALGSAYLRSGSLEDAEREYLEAIKVSPRLGEAHNNLAVIYMLTNRLDQAEEEIRQAERAGFQVNPQFKADLKERKKQ